MLFLLFITGCCRNPIAPILDTPQETTSLDALELRYSLRDLLIDSTLSIEEMAFEAQSNNSRITTNIQGQELIISSESENENGTIELRAIDDCDAEAIVQFNVQFGQGSIDTTECLTPFRYPHIEGAESVFLVGDFNDWTAEANPLIQQEDDSWKVDIALELGSYAYKFLVKGAAAQWTCDPEGQWLQCDAGQALGSDCSVGAESCNSIIVVEDCLTPKIELSEFSISGNNAQFSLNSASTELESIVLTVNGETEEITWQNTPLSVSLSFEARQSIQISANTADGNVSNTIHIPFWRDAFDWNSAVMYFAFVDRFSNGDPGNDTPFGATWESGDYMGGDWQGLIDKMDYLDAMGVNALWITSPLNNPEGLFGGSCDMTITGYHGYWPSDPQNLEEHFGDSALLHILIREAHSHGMRVLVDWVGNHTHEDHPWYQDEPEWFTEPHLCTEDDNWNQAPETCWFAPYVPSLNYYRPDVLTQSVNEAIDFAKEYDIDGFRVDAVKHMPEAVHWNLQKQIKSAIEHRDVGSPMEFYTVGETFSTDRDLIASYISDDMLDGQFDFSIYFKLLDTIAREEGPLYELEDEYFYSQEAYQGALMSNFLGNHDVERFISHANGEVSSLWGDGLCPAGEWRGPAIAPQDERPYQLLELAWTWLLTHPGTSLVYYGDEIGLAGYHDPDNRQMMPWTWTDYQSRVQAHVSTLSNARQIYPQLSQAAPIVWWGEPDWNVLGYALSSNAQHALVLLNRSGEWKDISNGLSWAGLPSIGTIHNILDGETKTLNSDQLNLSLSPYSSQVWIWE